MKQKPSPPKSPAPLTFLSFATHLLPALSAWLRPQHLTLNQFTALCVVSIHQEPSTPEPSPTNPDPVLFPTGPPEYPEEPTGISMSEFSRILNFSTAASTGTIDLLATRGLALRLASETDRRALHIQLTNKGRHLLNESAQIVEQVIAHLRPKTQDQ